MSAMRVSRCLTFPLSIGTVLIRHHGEAFLDPRTRALACLIDRMPLVVICVSLEYNLLSTLMIFFFSPLPKKLQSLQVDELVSSGIR
jgi:hypothetical protein